MPAGHSGWRELRLMARLYMRVCPLHFCHRPIAPESRSPYLPARRLAFTIFADPSKPAGSSPRTQGDSMKRPRAKDSNISGTRRLEKLAGAPPVGKGQSSKAFVIPGGYMPPHVWVAAILTLLLGVSAVLLSVPLCITGPFSGPQVLVPGLICAIWRYFVGCIYGTDAQETLGKMGIDCVVSPCDGSNAYFRGKRMFASDEDIGWGTISYDHSSPLCGHFVQPAKPNRRKSFEG